MGVMKSLFTDRSYRNRKTPMITTPEMTTGGNYYFNIDGHNEVIKAWKSMVTRKLKTSAHWFEGKGSMVMRGDRKEKQLWKSIRGRTHEDHGAVDRVTFLFERHGVFIHKGVGRGYQMSGNSVIRTAKGPQEKARVAVEWFNPVLNENLPELANKLAEINADAIINAERMKIQ
jgi:hypothetical protein